MINHQHYMQRALELGQDALGQAWPNPSVGAVIVQDVTIVGEGKTGKGGRPHAETVALEAAGKKAKGATLYVTLEPCSHFGKTSPCADAIIAAGIKTCVIACGDCNPEVNGEGIARLRAAGIEVIENICAEEAREQHAGFFSVIAKRRPFVAVKLATSADEKITTGTAEQWITSPAARNYGQALRSRYDAILTGIGTVLADDPLLTCRQPGLEDRSPVRVILDRNHRLPEDSQIARTQKRIPTWVLDLPDIPTVLTWLAGKGITRVLVEAGQKLNTAFLQSGAVDKVYWFKAPTVIGDAGLPVIEGSLASALADFDVVEGMELPPDTLSVYRRRLTP